MVCSLCVKIHIIYSVIKVSPDNQWVGLIFIIIFSLKFYHTRKHFFNHSQGSYYVTCTAVMSTYSCSRLSVDDCWPQWRGRSKLYFIFYKFQNGECTYISIKRWFWFDRPRVFGWIIQHNDSSILHSRINVHSIKISAVLHQKRKKKKFNLVSIACLLSERSESSEASIRFNTITR